VPREAGEQHHRAARDATVGLRAPHDTAPSRGSGIHAHRGERKAAFEAAVKKLKAALKRVEAV